MSEYINKEKILKFPIRIHHCDREHGSEHFVYGIECVMEYIENIPPADVVEVVRCKDCKYRFSPNNNDAHYCNYKYGLQGLVAEEDYCSYGERRDDNE